jgi:histidinol phosphatase-like enzyme
VVSAVFLDRDGVINANLERNGKPVAPTNLSDFRILLGVAEAARLLKEAGFLWSSSPISPTSRTD